MCKGFLGLIVDKSEPDLDLFKLLLPRDFFLIGESEGSRLILIL